MSNEELKNRICEIANGYWKMSNSDLQGCIGALEILSGVDYESLYRMVAEKVILNRIKKFIDRCISNPCYNTEYIREDFKSLCVDLEKRFECSIDRISYSISW